MRVTSIMSRSLVTVRPDDSVDTVRRLFDEHAFHHLLVVERGQLVGVISDRDLLRNISPFVGKLQERPQDITLLHRRVHQIMRRQPITVSPEAEYCDAARVMLEHKVSCLPVVDDRGRPVGVLTWRDLLRVVCPSDHCEATPRPPAAYPHDDDKLIG